MILVCFIYKSIWGKRSGWIVDVEYYLFYYLIEYDNVEKEDEVDNDIFMKDDDSNKSDK